MTTATLLVGVTAVSNGNSTPTPQRREGETTRVTAQVAVDGVSASYGATVQIQGSMNGAHWTTLLTYILSGAGAGTYVTDADTIDAPWEFCRANVTALTGAGTSVHAFLGA